MGMFEGVERFFVVYNFLSTRALTHLPLCLTDGAAMIFSHFLMSRLRIELVSVELLQPTYNA